MISRHTLTCWSLLLAATTLLRADIADPSSMTQERRNMLRTRYQDWQSLDQAEQDAIRQLHEAALQPGADGDRLRSLLDRYDRWLTTLTNEEKKKIESATNSAQRIERVKEILGKQTIALEESMLPSRPAVAATAPAPANEPRTGGRKPGFLRQRFDLMAGEIDRLDQIEKMFTEEEKQRLNSVNTGQKIPIMIALATKYGLPLPPFIVENQNPLLQSFMGMIPQAEKSLGTSLATALTDENRKKLGEVMVDMVMLPDLPQAKQFELLQSEQVEVRTGIERIAKINKTTARFLSTVLYYSIHPDRAPESCRDSLALLPPDHLRSLLSSNQFRFTGYRPPRSEDANRPSRVERRPPTK